jgi:hypothetical protein
MSAIPEDTVRVKLEFVDDDIYLSSPSAIPMARHIEDPETPILST